MSEKVTLSKVAKEEVEQLIKENLGQYKGIEGFNSIKNLAEAFNIGMTKYKGELGPVPPKKNGVYFVIINDKNRIKKVIPPEKMKRKVYKGEKEIKWDSEIEEKWENLKREKTNLLYIGKAEKDNKLFKRIRSYVRYGRKNSKENYTNNHAGGNGIWQISDEDVIDDLIFAWVEFEDASKAEDILIDAYKEKHKGMWPLANKKNGNKKG